jgi:hypothetical protein
MISLRPRKFNWPNGQIRLYLRLPMWPTSLKYHRLSAAFGRSPRGSRHAVQFFRTVPSTSRPALVAAVN